jgi:hypothetical protein
VQIPQHGIQFADALALQMRTVMNPEQQAFEVGTGWGEIGHRWINDESRQLILRRFRQSRGF